MTAVAREDTFALLRRRAQQGEILIGIGAASVDEIDRINILQATFLAMRRAVGRLGCTPDAALVDGNMAPRTSAAGSKCSSTATPGRCRSPPPRSSPRSSRDRVMVRLSTRYAGFGWATNVGYGTGEHIEAIGRLGPTKHHRLTFAPLAQLSLPL